MGPSGLVSAVKKLPVHQVRHALPTPGAGKDADTLEFAVQLANESLDRVAGLDPSSQGGRGFVKEHHPIDIPDEVRHGDWLGGLPPPLPSFKSRHGFSTGSGLKDTSGLGLNLPFARLVEKVAEKVLDRVKDAHLVRRSPDSSTPRPPPARRRRR